MTAFVTDDNDRTEAEFFTTFDEFLRETEPVKLQTPVRKFSQELPELLDRMKTAAESDEALTQRRIYKIEPEKAADIL